MYNVIKKTGKFRTGRNKYDIRSHRRIILVFYSFWKNKLNFILILVIHACKKINIFLLKKCSSKEMQFNNKHLEWSKSFWTISPKKDFFLNVN